MSAESATLDVSVVTYNSARWLDAFFKSLMDQALPAQRIRLLVRDNGSTDGTPERLRQLQTRFGRAFAEMCIDCGENIGFGRGHNANLAIATSPWFLVTNVDLEFEHDTLSLLLDVASHDVDQVAVWECRQKPFEHPKHYDPVTGYTEWSSSACALFRTVALKRVGGYEPRLFLYGEDVELSYRLRDNGFVLRYVPQATVWHHTYEHEAQIKPQQFLGSTLANVLLRCRYGNWPEVLAGFFMYLGLLAVPPRFEGQRWGLLRNGMNLLRLAPQFLSTRRRSDAHFPFRLWDYAMAREGAFYRYARHEYTALPLISVIIRTMPGRSGKLQEALASLLAQTYRPVELVLVEDGGNTALERVNDLKASAQLASVVYLPLPKSGRCAAGNAALQAATGALVCFLDDDDLLYADHLEVLANEWLKNPALGAVYGLAYQVRTDILSHAPWQYRDVEHTLVYRQPFNRALLWHHNYLPIQTVLFQRALFEEHGGFDPELENLEDWNLWVRYSLNHDFLMVPKVTSLYRVPALSQHATDRQQVLDDYYAKAQAKHAGLRVTLSPPQVIEIAESLSRELFMGGVPVSRLRSWVLKHRLLRRFYHPLRRLNHLLRRVRQR